MERARVTVVDWLMLLLAIISVALLAYEAWGSPTPDETRQILLVDYIIISIFAVEFSIRMAKSDDRRRFMVSRWYELIGMIPVGHPMVRGFRLFRVVRIFVILTRFGRAADRAFGERFTARFLTRFKRVIVEIVGDAIALRVLDQTLTVMAKGSYTRNMADHLEAQGDELLAIIVEKIHDDPKIGRVKRLPFFDDVVATSSRVTQRILIDLLRDERMDEMVKDVIRQNVQQIRAAVAEKESLADLRRPAASST